MSKIEAMFKNNKRMQIHAMRLLPYVSKDDGAGYAQEIMSELLDEEAKMDVIAFYSDAEHPKSFLRCSREFAKDILEILKKN